DLPGITFAVGTQCREIEIDLGEETGRHRDRNVPGEALAAEHRVDERATGPSVAIGERMDSFKLGMGQGGMYEDRKVVAVDERDQVIHQSRHVGMVRSDELCLMWTITRATDPHLLAT